MLTQIITILGPGAALLHMAWLFSFWMSRGVTWPTFVSGIVDVCLLVLTAGPAIEIVRDKLETRPTKKQLR